MNPTTHQNPLVTITSNCGNVTDSYNVWNNCKISMSDERRQILEWLSPLAPRERHQTVRDGRVGGVGNWLLQTNEFKKWHEREGQDVNPVLFCYGDPGVGKTYMTSLVIDTLCNQIEGENATVACVYCDFHGRQEQTATAVLGALLKQVVAGLEPIPDGIQNAFEHAKNKIDGRAPGLLEIRGMLVKSLSSLRRCFICIDALDEFPEKIRPKLWHSLQHIIQNCPNTRLFITGRPYIQHEVGKYFGRGATMIPIKPRMEDIERYLQMRLDSDPRDDIMNDSLRADILRVIPATISEIFLLVSLIVDAILEQTTIHQRKQTLKKMTNGLGLQNVYDTTLDRIREQKGSGEKLGMETLMWISRSERPLKVAELCHALAVEVRTADLNVENIPTIRTLLGCTLGLVAIDQKSSMVRLIHATLQEYLSTHTNLFITPHSMMAEVCLTYLNFRSVCGLSPTLRPIPSTTPFLRYASCYWGLHARKEMTESVKSLALELLQKDADHISANILLREESFGFLSSWDRWRGANSNLQGYTGLHCIAYLGIHEIATAMVEMKRWDLNGRDSNGATPLMWAVKYGNHTLIKLFLKQGDVNPNISDKNGLTPLEYAVKGELVEVVKLLLDQEVVNPNSLDKDGRTLLSYAVQWGCKRVVKLLLDREGVDPNISDTDGLTPLGYAVKGELVEVVKLLLDREVVNPNSLDKDGRTPLSYAAQLDYKRVVKLLLGREGVNPNISDKDGRTPLAFAAKFGNEDVVKLLLDREDVNPDSSSKCSRTPLSYAAWFGHAGVVKLLLDREGVNADSPDEDGRTPLSYAACFGRAGVVKLLLDREGVNADSPDEDGRTPLSYAAEDGEYAVVTLLLGRDDVNPDSSAKNGRTPLSYAAEYGYEGVMKLLTLRGAINPDPPSNDSQASLPASFCQPNLVEGTVIQVSQPDQPSPDPSSISHHSQHTPDLPAPIPSEALMDPVSQREDNIPVTRSGITGNVPLSHSDEPPSTPHTAPRPASILKSIANPNTPPAIIKPPGTRKRYLLAFAGFCFVFSASILFVLMSS